MSRKCQGGCNRFVDEYYKLKDGKIFCCDCWKWEKDFNNKRKVNEFQERERKLTKISNKIKDLDIKINNHDNYGDGVIYDLYKRKWELEEQENYILYHKSYDYLLYLSDATYYNKTAAEYDEIGTICKAKELLNKAKEQQKNNIYAKEVQHLIKEIDSLVQKETYTDSMKAIELLEKEYEWQIDKGDIFTSSLINIDNSRISFEYLRRNTINEAKLLLEKINKTIIINGKYNIISKINTIDELIRKETYKDAIKAIQLAKEEYIWKTDTGKEFIANLLLFNQKLDKAIVEEKEKEIKNIQKQQEENERELKKEERRQEEEAKKMTKIIIIIAVIIVFIYLFIYLSTFPFLEVLL